MRLTFLFGICLLVISSLIALVLILHTRRLPDPILGLHDQQSPLKSYKDKDYGFTFSFPKSYTVVNKEKMVLALERTSTASPDASIVIVPFPTTVTEGVRTQSLLEKLRILCKQVNKQSPCTSLDSQSVITNTQGTTGTVYHFSQIKNKNPSISLKLLPESNPFYVYTYPDSSKGFIFLIIYSLKEENALVQAITTSLTLPDTISLPTIIMTPSIGSGSSSAK